jgi:tRNA-2-methylthio-N6-dimethylallyladenosine synthase
MRRQVPEAAKTERLSRLQALLAEQAGAFNRSTVGRTLPVLLERAGRHPGQLVGRSPYLQPVHVAAPGATPGQTIDVLITASHAHSLAAVPAPAGAAGLREDLPACA